MAKKRKPRKPTMAEQVQQVAPERVCSHSGCKRVAKPRECPYSADVHDVVESCMCCDYHANECADSI